jgi:hypothetical protein
MGAPPACHVCCTLPLCNRGGLGGTQNVCPPPFPLSLPPLMHIGSKCRTPPPFVPRPPPPFTPNSVWGHAAQPPPPLSTPHVQGERGAHMTACRGNAANPKPPTPPRSPHSWGDRVGWGSWGWLHVAMCTPSPLTNGEPHGWGLHVPVHPPSPPCTPHCKDHTYAVCATAPECHDSELYAIHTRIVS